MAGIVDGMINDALYAFEKGIYLNLMILLNARKMLMSFATLFLGNV